MFDAMEEGVFVLDSTGKVVAFNESLLKILGVTEAEIQQNDIRAVSEDGSPILRDDLPAYVTLRKGTNLSGIILGVPKNAGIIWVSVNTKLLLTHNPPWVMSTVVNITHTKTTEKLLRESDNKLRAFIREAPVGIMTTNEAHSCDFANKTWSELTGTPLEDCLGLNWPKAVHEDDARELFLGRKRLSGLGTKVQMGLRFVHPDSKIVWVNVKAIPMFDGSGLRTGFLWTASDVTERRKAEAERDRFFTMSMDMLCLANTRGYLTRVNPSFSETLGWSAEELYSKPLVDIVHPEDKLDAQEAIARLSNGYEGASFEIRVRSKSTHWRWLEWTCSAAENGVIYAVARDITEKKSAQEALRLLAHTDQLTGLHNRTTLMSQLSAKIMQAEQFESRVAVLFLDLDGFKTINDTYGHDSGDFVIREIGSRLVSCVRRSDTVARLGGDEYVLVLGDMNEKAVEQVSLKILAQIAEPLTLPNGYTIYPQASIGVSCFPDDGNDPEGLVKAADKAMYTSKRAGGHRCS
jgi:diguanylate cyclase (GGDEF)-like protein/PAS domain S-box-containing protein